jgi:hypothetical protein
VNARSVATLFGELLERPDIEEAETGYLALLTALRTTLVEEVGLSAWTQAVTLVNASGAVGEYARLGQAVEVRRYQAGISPGAISDADWPRARAQVFEIARDQGFGAPTVVVERPGDHEVSFVDTFGAELLFGTAVNTTLGLSTGCHLTRHAHQRSGQGSLPSTPGRAP